MSECLASGEAFLLGHDMAEGIMDEGSVALSSSLESLSSHHGVPTFMIPSAQASHGTLLQILFP